MLHYFDRASMAHSLEVRVPSSTTSSSNGRRAFPSSLKVSNGRTKHILKEAASRFLPPEIVDKPKIGFFNRSLDASLERQATPLRGCSPLGLICEGA